ncbi:MAG: Tim44-like domain-containing protein [Pseudomonadota bacterium]|nr:Tim44-like domain-containing protein [Pseudomonadota bacterium]
MNSLEIVALLFIREWPPALTGSVWAVGTVFAVGVWLLRSSHRPEWLSGQVMRHRLARGSSGPSSLVLNRPAPALRTDVSADQVLEAARRCFVTMQAAWDAADVEKMRLHTTPNMLDELLQELPLRGLGPNRTDVVSLNAALLGLEEVGSAYIASVEFSGMIRESSEQGAAPFKELWMLTCSREELPGWRLARHQALL